MRNRKIISETDLVLGKDKQDQQTLSQDKQKKEKRPKLTKIRGDK